MFASTRTGLRLRAWRSLKYRLKLGASYVSGFVAQAGRKIADVLPGQKVQYPRPKAGTVRAALTTARGWQHFPLQNWILSAPASFRQARQQGPIAYLQCCGYAGPANHGWCNVF